MSGDCEGWMFMAIDASSFIHRGWHASKMQDQTYAYNSRGEPIGAIKKFMESMFYFRQRGAAERKPTHFAVCFDAPNSRWTRAAILPTYKSDRPEMDPDLKRQLPLMREAAAALGLACVEVNETEADDVLGCLALTVAEEGGSVLIISGDKDLCQLVQDGIALWDPPAGVEGYAGYRPARLFECDADVIAKFGVPAHQVVEVQALAGDPGDCIPGILKIGITTAAKLIREHGTMEAVLAAAPGMKASKMRDNLIEHAEAARTAMKLVKLDTCVDYDVPINRFALAPLDHDAALAFAERHQIDHITRLIEKDRDYVLSRRR
jgi:DNA polymerase-1